MLRYVCMLGCGLKQRMNDFEVWILFDLNGAYSQVYDVSLFGIPNLMIGEIEPWKISFQDLSRYESDCLIQ